ncbi:anti-sigma F factor [Gelria sp. Kuro-4]|uniref:anti-sigma F factor n=1 Tax=Gelria sp. Kuro-4 TaxID=2796927 RepID=UPI001BF11A2E|nr:anti-sigma F factor [Gelria sp. Kuro-4]BCV25310.1 anti-sigma F factor [Gelria sp. Kuro-4]
MKENEMRLEFPSRPENVAFARATVAAFASQLDPTLPELADISTAVSEAVTNAVVHAYPEGEGPVRIAVRLAGRRVIIEVADEGRGIADIGAARRFGGSTRPGERMGIGLSLIEACMDRVEVNSSRGTCVHMEKTLGERRGGQDD